MKQIEDLIQRLIRLKEEKRSVVEPVKSSELPRCTICQDRGVVLNGDVAKICLCMRQSYLEHRYRFANVTPEIRDCSFEGFRLDYYEGVHREMAAKALQGARQFVTEYLQNFHIPGILFTGDVGAGKTYLAGAITNFLLQYKIQVFFLVVPDFLDELRATYHKGISGEGSDLDDVSLLRSVRQVDVLILDDLGVHNYTPWTCNKLYSLLNFRLNFRLPVIITTNLTLGQLEEFLGERTTSRIVQMCRIYRLSVSKDIRHLKNRNGSQIGK
ncbi:MAG: ATP-binding protein [Bacillota bacterium]|nr:ATP-binding protein [Bacillota bacterium]